jgi:predicted TIM-barrel fold metal-dependent hydrolase
MSQLSGSTLSEPFDVFDVHQHYGSVPGSGAPAARVQAEVEVVQRIEIMDKNGIRQACIQPSSGYDRPRGTLDLMAVNDEMATLRSLATDRFPVALGTIDLALGETAVSLEVRRIFDELELDGIAWHHRLQGAYIDDPRMYPILNELASRGKIAAIHVLADSTFESPWRLENLADRYPELKFIAMDAFSSYERASWMSRIAAHHPNIFFDTAGMITSSSILARFVAGAGADRLLFGTNLYGAQQTDYYPAAMQIVLASSELSTEAKRRVLGANARELFGIS